MDVDTRDKVIEKGYRAARLLEDPAFKETLDEISDSLHIGLESVPTDNQEHIMSMVSQLRAIRWIVGKLESAASSGRTQQAARDGKI